ncbi:putative hydroxymethyltransferase [Hypoxylon rubiginosum]|uniref:Hydroxymethyltransferase n=1 Tax=Hypoxylon rubiginosum TaxID=110542 RepID=A0ACC0CKM2_9PEZI|nr:putative hydroxymethyltransferase [Hypoxylon rubiginosum]
MSENIDFKVRVDSTSEWYGTLVVYDIKNTDGSALTVDQYLGVTFKSPPVTSDIVVDFWEAESSEVSTETIDSTSVAVTVRINFASPYTFQSNDEIKFEINGDILTDPDTWTQSFELYADDLPSGTVKVDCAPAPDQRLAGSEQVVTLSRGGWPTPLTVVLGSIEENKVAAGTYTVTADELTTADETVVATAQVSPSELSVVVDQSTTVTVTYSAVNEYSAMDVSIGQLSSPIDKETLQVKVIERSTGNSVADFYSHDDHTSKLRRLPLSGTVDVSAEVTLNNVKYFATKVAALTNAVAIVSIDQSDVVAQDLDTTGFVDLTVKITTDLSDSNASIDVRLSSTASNLLYDQVFQLNTDSAKFDVPVAPGDYTVKASGFFDGTTVYKVETPASFRVATDGSSVLELSTLKGADLDVHGFPNYLSFGGLTDLVDMEGTDFVNAQASSLFKYAGSDGGGDPDRYLEDDPVTTRTVQLAATVESKLGSDHPVLPVLISYTVNLSGGDVGNHLKDADSHAHSFGNLILSMSLAKQYGKEDVPAGYIVNPDFLGACQQDGGFTASYAMPVRQPLTDALAYREVDVEIPDNITDTLAGYVLAVNWLIRTVGEGITFGWQINLWGGGDSNWIYNRDDNAPAEKAIETAKYVKSLGVYNGKYAPDFLAIDRYEGDDFTVRGYTKGYCYGPYEWGRFFDFCSAVSFELQVPVVPWQIPASRIPNKDEDVVDLETEHWGTGGTYIFGDEKINTDYHNIHPKILAIKPSGGVPFDTVEDLFIASQPFDLSDPTYGDFPMRGIVAVLLGGGSTTGIVSDIGTTGPWTQEKLSVYMESPIPFSADSST